VKQPINVKVGIEQEKAKSIVKLIKDSKMKLQASIQEPRCESQGEEGRSADGDSAGAEIRLGHPAPVPELRD